MRGVCISLRSAQWSDQHANSKIQILALPALVSQADALCNVGATAKLGGNGAVTTEISAGASHSQQQPRVSNTS